VDDHELVRRAVRALLRSREPPFDALEAGNAGDALKVARDVEPAAIIVDVTLPDGSGIDLVRDLRTLRPAARIIVMTGYDSLHFMHDAVAAGAHAYLLKADPGAELGRALSAVLNGEAYASPSVPHDVVEALRASCRAEQDAVELTHRERQVLDLAAQGKSLKEVAQALDISEGTAKKHRENLMRKLGVHSAAELVRFASDRPAGSKDLGGPEKLRPKA
jgi:DNA-binding NarL/FixJ family response regulator